MTLTSGSTSTLSPGSPVTATADLATGNLTLNSRHHVPVQVNGTTPDTRSRPGDRHRQRRSGRRRGALPVRHHARAPASRSRSSTTTGRRQHDGFFTGRPEGSSVGMFNGVELFITYNGGDGNDVVLTTTPTVSGTTGNDTLVLRQVSGIRRRSSSA